MIDQVKLYDRLMTRSAFQSLFWVIFSSRKRQEKLTKKALADKLGINKSFVTRAFDEPPNWQLDTISDMSDALGVELVIEARDRQTGIIYTPSGERHPATTSSSLEHVRKIQTGSNATTSTDGGAVVAA